jgi:capsular exopolysaccharide synthesis family protein
MDGKQYGCGCGFDWRASISWSPYNENTDEIPCGSIFMSRFFDLLQRLNQQKGHSSSASSASAQQNKDVASELDRALSVLLSQDSSYSKRIENGCESRQTLSVLRPQGPSYPASLEEVSELKRIPVEEVHILPESRIVFHTDPNSPGADRFRLLRMRLQVLWNARKLKTLLITSPLPGDGKSTIALNLATALAEKGKRSVLLIEADLHRSPLTQELGLRAMPGLAECMESGLDSISAVRRLEPLGWYLLSAGEARSNPTELLQGETFSVVMQKLSPLFDWIVIDSPPVTPLSDALSLARIASASLLVTRSGQTPSDAVEKAIGLIGREHVLGIVLNGVEDLDQFYSGYYGYSGGNNGRASGDSQPAASNSARQATNF